jgi:two-component system sensor histidine kinase DegS
MCDNNLSNDKKQIDELAEDRKETCNFLKNLSLEYEERLLNINMQLMSERNSLQEKEKELYDIESKKVHNRDFFSPICSKTYDTSTLNEAITQIKLHINNLNQEQQMLSTKISGLKKAAGYISSIHNDLKTEEADKNPDYIQNIAEKGLSILEAQEIERQRIARDLHDTTVQNLTSLVHKSELCVKLIDIDMIRSKLELNAMSNTLKIVINDMRGIIYNLKPMTLDDLGLTITVQRFANRLMSANNIQVRVVANEEVKDILPVIKLTVFRIIQEACNNVIKHANADLINIDIMYNENNVTVSIKDNGIGFNSDNSNSNSSEQSSSFGLSIMKERISLLSGTLEIKSEKKKGTNVTISVPLTTHEGDK